MLVCNTWHGEARHGGAGRGGARFTVNVCWQVHVMFKASDNSYQDFDRMGMCGLC